MFNTRKTLIIVYKDALLMNQLKKLIETSDDEEGKVIGTKDDSIEIISWTEKVWMSHKKAGNIKGKILFLGEIKGNDDLIPVLDMELDEDGVKYGRAGDQAILWADPKALTNRESYDAFLEKLSEFPVPAFLKKTKNNIVETGSEEDCIEQEVEDEGTADKKPKLLAHALKVVEAGVEALDKVGDTVSKKTEEIFRDKTLVKKQMMFYGVIKLYTDYLEDFMNQ